MIIYKRNHVFLVKPTLFKLKSISLDVSFSFRNILQRWRRSLHVPLRLDVVYDMNQRQSELLERWCIDYIPSSNLSDAPIDNNETISQLRQVCKRVVILLRSLFCVSRMLPSYNVHRQISQQNINTNSNQYYENGQSNRPTGTIGFTIYAASQYINCGNTASSVEIPPRFLHRNFKPVSTPFGKLFFSVLYHPNPIQQRPTRAIAIAGTKAFEEREIRRYEGHSEGDDSDWRISDYNESVSGPQTAMVVDAEVNNYNPVKDHKINENNVADPFYKKGKAMSGLSLALMGQCQISSEELNKNNSDMNSHDNNLVSKSYDKPSHLTRLYANEKNESQSSIPYCKSYEKPSYLKDRNHSSLANNTNFLNNEQSNVNRSNPRSILSSNTVYSTNTPSSVPTQNHFPNVVENEGISPSGEYGYGYNGYAYKPVNPRILIPPANTIRRVSPSQVAPLGSTPPLSHNISGLGQAHMSPLTLNASPPFQKNPLSLIPLQHESDLSSTPPNSNMSSLQNILAKPPDLEVLPKSPFQVAADSNSLLSSRSMQIPLDCNEPSLALPFVGSFGSTHSSPNMTSVRGVDSNNPLLRSLYKSGIASSVIDHQNLDGGDHTFEEMPFATDTSPDASSCSIHAAGETDAASSFAHRCSTASRLQLFDRSGINNTAIDNDTNLRQNSNNADLVDQLSEFRKFGSSLLRSSANSLEPHSGSSEEMNASTTTPTPTPVA